MQYLRENRGGLGNSKRIEIKAVRGPPNRCRLEPSPVSRNGNAKIPSVARSSQYGIYQANGLTAVTEPARWDELRELLCDLLAQSRLFTFHSKGDHSSGFGSTWQARLTAGSCLARQGMTNANRLSDKQELSGVRFSVQPVCLSGASQNGILLLTKLYRAQPIEHGAIALQY
ncbi:hypothetical protein RRG08_004356 [Elysia crispata]|uniref:Uncharacterized protein n=1 Tax=Elysia crispata TaxID=231223 RepID=A0AAE0Z8H2_9GAST|nr:hypothetical protein RRG08_004356 [Elysia crispata]